MSGFSSPNYTQTPNDLFDSLLAELGEAELRVILVAVRQTLGYHKRYDGISLTKFEKMTGLSRQGVIDGIEAAVARGLLREVGKGKRGVNIYELVIVVDQSTSLTSQDNDQSTELTGTSQASRHTKETPSKEKELKKVPALNGAATLSSKKQESLKREANPIFDAVAQHIFETDPAQVNGEGGRIGPIAVWLAGKSDGAKRGGKNGTKEVVGFISAPAEPKHVQQFAADWKAEHRGADLPLDFVKFVEAWRAWASKRKAAIQRKQQQQEKKQEAEPTAEELAALERARQTIRPAWEKQGGNQ